MSETARLLLAFAAGSALSALYFLTLWWTVNRAVESSGPLGLMIGSFIVRNVVVLGGFWWCGTRGLQELITAFVGFLLMRAVLMRKLGPRSVAGPSAPAAAGDDVEGQETSGR